MNINGTRSTETKISGRLQGITFHFFEGMFCPHLQDRRGNKKAQAESEWF
jgi:hypothetical protein